MRRECLRAAAGLAAAAVLAGCGSSKEALTGRLVTDRGPVGETGLVMTPLDREGDAPGATTDARGRFEFTGLAKGRYRLTAHYNVADVFECDIPFVVDVPAADKTTVRRFAVPLIDIEPGGTARLPTGKKTTCRTLRDPLEPYICSAAQFPLTVYALPPRDGLGHGGYRRLRALRKTACAGARVLGRVSGVPAQLGWLFISVGGGPGARGWINASIAANVSRQLRAWKDVAAASVARLPKLRPTLPGGGLPDLAFTTPVQSVHEGDPCTVQFSAPVQWLVAVRNVGTGLASKKLEVFMRDPGLTEVRQLGSRRWVRGLAPSESVPIEMPEETVTGKSYIIPSSFTELTIDPNDVIAESDESNNSLKLGLLPNLECR